jgi:hypothetical protein
MYCTEIANTLLMEKFTRETSNLDKKKEHSKTSKFSMDESSMTLSMLRKAAENYSIAQARVEKEASACESIIGIYILICIYIIWYVYYIY